MELRCTFKRITKATKNRAKYVTNYISYFSAVLAAVFSEGENRLTFGSYSLYNHAMRAQDALGYVHRVRHMPQGVI